MQSEEIIPINEDLSAHYSVFKNGYVFKRAAGAWREWEKLTYTPPTSNPWLIQTANANVQFDCCEHVSVALNGDASYFMQTPNGAVNFPWSRGTHNVDNGLGYLPSEQFTRTFQNDYTTCCIVQPFTGRDTPAKYTFTMYTGPSSLTQNSLCIHYCTGPRAKQTDMAATAGTPIDITEGDIAIAVFCA